VVVDPFAPLPGIHVRKRRAVSPALAYNRGMALDDATCYRAFASRDRRFEGRFVIAVRTTHVYCRPGCPARLPRRENVRFYPTPAAAEAAGFRPCRRCRPDASPGTPLASLTAPTVARAARLIHDGALDGGGVEALARRLGVGDRHLRRLFAEELGATPLRVARTRRVHFGRRLLESTDLPVQDVALAAGFGSLRAFHAAFRETFRAAPSEFRRGPETKASSPGPLELRLPCRGSLGWKKLLAFLAERAIPGVEAVAGDAYHRTIRVGERTGAFSVRPAPDGRGVSLRLDLETSRDLPAVVSRIARMFDLEADVESIGEHLKRDERLREALRKGPAPRLPGAWDPFEIAVRAILGQQVSVRAARTLAARLVERYGEQLAAEEDEAPSRLFPTPAAIAAAELGSFGLPSARAASIATLARAVRDGELDFGAFATLDDAVARLTEIPGIGPWTAHYVALRALGEPDAFPAGDLGIRRALARNGRPPSEREVVARAERWRPWRAYAVIALWTEDPR
jgi:AraC family transcriptional regulator, regulatory protein of adaptative response / DNA-3-methyladenine glycosylase II